MSLCKKGAYLINTGRGPLIDEQAVCDALKSGQLGGAALDVLVKEPPEKNNPLIELAKTMPNLIITPHIAWASDSAVTTLTKKVAQTNHLIWQPIYQCQFCFVQKRPQPEYHLGRVKSLHVPF